MPTIDYASPGPFTSLRAVPPASVDQVVGEPIEVCWPTHSLVIQPLEADQLGLPRERFATNQVRHAEALVAALLALDPSPLDSPRAPDLRVVGTCRHFAVLSCALLRHRGVPARVRCGFATYFQPGQALDHWITEHWSTSEARWIRVDTELLGGTLLERPQDLTPDQFLSGGEAWQAYRSGRVDASTFGVFGTDNWGPSEIRGNTVRDLAALNKVETLPWDEWGRMTDAYEGKTGSAYDDLLDLVAATCAADNPADVAALYAHADLQVPSALSGSLEA